ncbi:DUF423 domain-containing protein [Marinomonas sp. C2222]|uniref:DUF423 domain-containing protein n=1 Tax=Marinomonas sargassi TaxID=2984494 RepID=A0ABT2YP47_9GAMM|nr:DUF423 domain-containing protein [Marinomonas sargassi]MCV2401665.1 DUF423 domain-containing protein [Marinomonas sargassi]
MKYLPLSSSNVLSKWTSLFCLQGLLSVAAGAFAAHALEGVLTLKAAGWWSTGSQYLMYHSIVGMVVSLTLSELARVRVVLRFFLCGNFLFSGSLYAMALTDFRYLGIITPLGGTMYLLAWSLLSVQLWRSK